MKSCDEQNSFKKSHMTLIWIGFDASSRTDISTIPYLIQTYRLKYFLSPI